MIAVNLGLNMNTLIYDPPQLFFKALLVFLVFEFF